MRIVRVGWPKWRLLAGGAFFACAYPHSGASAQSNFMEAEDPPKPSSKSAPSSSRVAKSSSNQHTQKPESEPSSILDLPLFIDETNIGNIRAQITINRILALAPADLAELLDDLLDKEAAAALSKLGSDLVDVEELRARGYKIELDPARLVIEFDIPSRLRGSRLIVNSATPRFDGLEAARPANFATGMTFSSFTTGDFTDFDNVTSILNTRGFANLGGAEGINLTYGGALNINAQGTDFFRDRVVLFKDDLENVRRYSAGDILPLQTRFNGDFDIFGLSVERFYQDLQPNRNVRPLGRSSFLLERPATVEIYVNGALLRTIQAEAGPIDIREIPVTELSNNVSIVVQDALGRREIDSFSIGNDVNLLGEGLSEFSFSAGLLRDDAVQGFTYTSDPVFSAFYTRGISDTLTLGASAVVTEFSQNAGLLAAFAGFGGVSQVDLAMSRRDGEGEGFAVSTLYRGNLLDLGFGPAQTNFRAEFRSKDFQPLSSFGFIENIKFDLALDARANVSESTQLVLGANYISRYEEEGEQYSLFGGFQRQIGRINFGAIGRFTQRQSGEQEVGLLLTAALVFGRRSNIFASFDTITQTGRFEYRQQRPLTLPEFELGARAQYGPDAIEAGGRVGFATSRFEALLDTQQEFDRDGDGTSNRSSLRFQTGFGFADGKIGIGRDPGRGFILVDKHPSLDEASVRVSTGSIGRDLGFANDFGPAIVPVFTPHRPQEIRVAAQNAPTGYNIGAGEYVALPGARTGVTVTVGSEEFRIAIVSIVRPDGEPLGLSRGRVTDLDTGEQRSFFTNRSGRAVFTKLKPGRYKVEVDETGFEFEFEVSGDDPANIQLGEIGR